MEDFLQSEVKNSWKVVIWGAKACPLCSGLVDNGECAWHKWAHTPQIKRLLLRFFPRLFGAYVSGERACTCVYVMSSN